MFRKLFSKAAPKDPIYRADLSTDSGMLCVWDAKIFAGITGYDAWEKELCEDVDILRHIKAGHFVPLNLGDGAFAVEVRRGSPAMMSDREKAYLLVPSQPYLLRTSGRIFISGLEQVGSDPRSFLELSIPNGNYIVRVQLIDWTAEPGAKDATGNPTAHALPDMIVFIEDIGQQALDFRIELETFRKEDALR